jgi:hypothetical protein
MSHQHVNQSSYGVEFYTLADIIEPARQVLGAIDLDPASSEIANQTVRAARIYTEADDGLAQPWAGRVWMNHPWGAKENACAKNCKKKRCEKRGGHLTKAFAGNAAWVDKLHQSYVSGQVSAALCITYASTSEAWYKTLKAHYPACYLDGRTGFRHPDGTVADQNTKGCVVHYLGPEVARFNQAFAPLGDVLVPYRRAVA